MSAPRLHGRRIGPIVPPLMEQDPLSTSSLYPTRGRWPTISGITILLPMAAVFAVVVLVHLPNQRAMDHAIQDANEDTIRAITVAPYAEAVQAIEEVVLSMGTIAAATQSSNIDMGTAQVLGIDNASGPPNATLSVPDEEVMVRMQNASLHWDQWWIRWLRTMVAKKLLADGVSYSAEYVRRDGLCIGVLDSLSNVLYRGNCSSCSFVFAQWSSPRTADLPLQLSNWTRDFSGFDNRLRCSPVDEVACASSKYFHNPPQSYQDDRNAFFSAPEVSWSATRSCFGRYETSFRSPVRGGGGAVGAFTLYLSSYHLVATARPGMPSIFVDSRGGVFPIHKIPDAMHNFTRDSKFVWCIDDALDVICLPTLGTVVAYWPVMYAAIVAAEVALTSALPTGAATTTTWTSDGQGGRIFVVATASSRPAGFYVRYAKEEDLTGRLTAALKRSRTMSVAISVALFVVALFMMAVTLLLLRTATYELRHACAHSIHQALTDRLRALPLPRQQGHQPQSAIGEGLDAQSSTVGPAAMTTGRAARDHPSTAAPAGPQGNASFNRSASSRARVKLHRMQLQQHQGAAAASATLHSSPNPLSGVTTEARQPSTTAHYTSYRIAQSNVDGTRTASITKVLASRLNVRLLAWGKAFKEPRLLLDATDSIARSIHAVIAYVPAGALVSLNVKEEAYQKDRRLGATSNTSWCATLDCFGGFCNCCRSRRDEDVQLPSDVQSDCRVEMSPLWHSSVRGARGELSAMVPSLQRQTCRPSSHHSPVVLANRVAAGSGNAQQLQGNGDTHEGRSTACANSDIHLPPVLVAQPPQSIASAFVVFDIGWCALDEPVVAKEYMRLMDMVVSMFGRFGGFVDVVEASTVVASFNLHLPCDDFCDRAVQCATSLLRAMDEKLKIWSLDEESISLRTFATEFIIAVDAGVAALDNFSFMRTSPQSERTTRVRSVVVESKTMVRLRALVPFLRDQQLACTATLSVLRYGDVSVPLVAADIVTWAHDETVVLYNAEGSDGVDVATLQIESNLIEEALGHMGRCEYDAALRVLGQYEWGDCSPVDRMQSIAHAQVALNRDAQVPYKAEYDALRSWRLQ